MTLRGTSYETAEEVAFRLNKTVVLYDGEPVYITRTEVYGSPNDVSRVYFKTLPLEEGQPEVRKYLSSRKFDLTPIKLGYFYYVGEDKVVRAVREAVRQNKQGLSSSNCRFKALDGHTLVYSFERLLYDSFFVNMLKREGAPRRRREELVSLKRSLDKVSYVLTNDFMMIRDSELETDTYYYKNDVIAVIPQNCSTFSLPEAFSFLEEEAKMAGLY